MLFIILYPFNKATMQETMLQRDVANLDLSKVNNLKYLIKFLLSLCFFFINCVIYSYLLLQVAALQQKRTLAFVNHFAITTVQFLNNFVKNCEQKLMHFERKLEKVEAAMVLLEARVSQHTCCRFF